MILSIWTVFFNILYTARSFKIAFTFSVPDFSKPGLLKDFGGMEIICVDGKAKRGTVRKILNLKK